MTEDKESTVTIMFFLAIVALSFVVGVGLGYYWHFKVIATGGG